MCGAEEREGRERERGGRERGEGEKEGRGGRERGEGEKEGRGGRERGEGEKEGRGEREGGEGGRERGEGRERERGGRERGEGRERGRGGRERERGGAEEREGRERERGGEGEREMGGAEAAKSSYLHGRQNVSDVRGLLRRSDAEGLRWSLLGVLRLLLGVQQQVGRHQLCWLRRDRLHLGARHPVTISDTLIVQGMNCGCHCCASAMADRIHADRVCVENQHLRFI